MFHHSIPMECTFETRARHIWSYITYCSKFPSKETSKANTGISEESR